MTIRDAVRLSLVNLRKNPVRTALTILGLGVGVGAILTVITLGVAGEKQVKAEIARLGVDKVWITAAQDSPVLLGKADGEAAARAVSAPACAEAMTAGWAALEDTVVQCRVCGYDAGFEAVYHPQVAQGRGFTREEYGQAAPVALLDKPCADAFGGDAVGRWIDLGSRMVRIVGVVEPVSSELLGARGGSVILPLATFMETYSAPGVGEVTISVPEGRDAEEMGRSAVAALSSSGGSYEAASLQKEIEAVSQVTRIFVMVLACVAAVCMLTGSIGVMNILLVSVRERRREIGLIKAVGGTSAQVGLLFLLEAVCYAVLGGGLGLLLGLTMIRLFGAWIGLEAVLDASTALPTLLAAALLGVGFGVAPAVRAAGMQPVDALRQE